MSEKKSKRIANSQPIAPPVAPIELTDSLVKQWIEDAKIEVLQDAKPIVGDMIDKANHETFQKAQEEINKQSQASQASFISVFGIFASIISFLGIEIQFLKALNTAQEILGFSLVLFAMLLSFNVALDYLARSKLDNKNVNSSYGLFGLIIISFITGLILIVLLKVR